MTFLFLVLNFGLAFTGPGCDSTRADIASLKAEDPPGGIAWVGPDLEFRDAYRPDSLIGSPVPPQQQRQMIVEMESVFVIA
ncbi:MAG: hypothetical protein M3R43_07495 [Acidobacteriota bacterium]|nr:hypothetical protein [Acidobacteriota bacterium]